MATVTGATFSNFPTNVLQTILEYACAGLPVLIPFCWSDQRVQVSLVCHTWLNAVHTTPSLWDNILFAKPQNKPYPPGTVIEKQLSTCVVRCGSNNISISFKMMQEEFTFSIVKDVVVPYCHRLKALACPLYGRSEITTFLCLNPGRFSVLESIDIWPMNTWDERMLLFEDREIRQFTALLSVPNLTRATLRFFNGLPHTKFRLPWHQLNSLNVISHPISPSALLELLATISLTLEEAHFLVEFAKPLCPHHSLPTVSMHRLTKLELELLYPSEDKRLFSSLRLPSVQNLMVKMFDQYQDWDVLLYTKFLRASSKTLRRLLLIDFLPPHIPRDCLKCRCNEISFQAIEKFFTILSNVELLHLPFGIPIYIPTLEKMATCAILPRLRILSTATVDPGQVIRMAADRNRYARLLPGSSHLFPKILPSPLTYLHLKVPSSGRSAEQNSELLQSAKELSSYGIDCVVRCLTFLPLPMRKPVTLARTKYFTLPEAIRSKLIRSWKPYQKEYVSGT